MKIMPRKDNYQGKTAAQLQKLLAGHKKKSEGKKPDDAHYKKRRECAKKEMNSLRLEFTQLKYERDLLEGECKIKQKRQNELLVSFKGFRDKLDEKKKATNAVTKQLKSNLGDVSRIKNPSAMLKDLQKEEAEEKHRLRAGNISGRFEEQKAMRNLKLLKAKIEKVQEYIDMGYDKTYQEQSKMRDAERKYRNDNSDKIETYEQAKEQNTAVRNKIKANEAQQKLMKGKLQDAQSKLNQVEDDKKSGFEKYRSWNDTFNDLRRAVMQKERDEEEDKAIGQAKENKSSQSSSVASEMKAETKKPENEPKGPVVNVDDLRAAAKREYEAVQARLKAQRAAADSQQVPEGSLEEDVKPEAAVDDPHRQEKELCRTLISYCQQNLPKQNTPPSTGGKKKKRRRKKKIRLQHNPANFTSFAKVGVGIPIWSTDLPKCINDLQARIDNYANQDDVKDAEETTV